MAMGVEFVLWVRYCEEQGKAWTIERPAGVEGWLPIASLMNLKALLLEGTWPRIHPAGTVLLIVFLLAALLMRKSFCGWLCPVGTVSELLWRAGKRFLGRNFRLPRWLDIPLRGIKYALMGLFLYAVLSMPVFAIRSFLDSEYGVVADVKLLNFFRNMESTGFAVLLLLAAGSMLVQNFWCRYLCPYGALMGLFSTLSPLKIRRTPSACIDCAKCAKACPAALPVDRLVKIQSAECLGCMQCVAVCPAEGALALTAPGKRQVPAWAVAACLAGLFVGGYTAARVTGHWNTDLPQQVLFELVPRADQFGHP